MLEILLIVLFVLISILDIMTTSIAIQKGLYEYNLILKYIYRKFKTKGHIFFKLITLAGYIIAVPYIAIEALVAINIVFVLVVINNLWEIQNVPTRN